MIRRRGVVPAGEDESSSEDEDVFSEMSSKAKPTKRMKVEQPPAAATAAATADTSTSTSTSNSSSAKIKTSSDATNNLPVSLTSSMKRHHKPNDVRKAQMEALIEELEAENKRMMTPSSHNKNRDSSSSSYYSSSRRNFIPDKKGSFVEPSEEHVTTNIFVGNLAPSITEEDLAELFSQFGELYSVKIMWPRTQIERSRKRNTGFVCFMTREDAEEAMETISETDPFDVDRRLMMRWGKNVKKLVKQGTGGGITKKLSDSDKARHGKHEEEKRSSNQVVKSSADPTSQQMKEEDDDGMVSQTNQSNSEKSEHRQEKEEEQLQQEKEDDSTTVPPKYQPELHSVHAFHVECPNDPDRFHFISAVASYVARDGSQIEKVLKQQEVGNPSFNFLSFNPQRSSEQDRKEHIFYRWRIYSFCQGDTYSGWKTEPFVMFHPYGRFWIPPPHSEEAIRYEKMENERKREEENLRNAKKKKLMNRRGQYSTNKGQREYLTGRQLERSRHGGSRRKGNYYHDNDDNDNQNNSNNKDNKRGTDYDDGYKLTPSERDEFDVLVKRNLTISREAICIAMAFCFEKSHAAKQISTLLKEVMVDDDSSRVPVDIRIARLYLISDILFNSQQPGVKNAFMYRDALEKMAPDIFASLGRHGRNDGIGRMTMNKLKTAVSSVLGAWTEWSVYNPTFLDELEARFDGREIEKEQVKDDQKKTSEQADDDDENMDDGALIDARENVDEEKEEEVVINKPRGDWTEVNDEDEEADGDDDPMEVEGTTSSTSTATKRRRDSSIATDSVQAETSHREKPANAENIQEKEKMTDRTSTRTSTVDDEKSQDADANVLAGRAVPPNTNRDEQRRQVGGDDKNNEDGKDMDGAPVEAEDDLDGVEMDDIDGESVATEDLEGVELETEDDDETSVVDGKNDGANGVAAAAAAAVAAEMSDGIDVNQPTTIGQRPDNDDDDDDLDGEPVEDLDGEPVEEEE